MKFYCKKCGSVVTVGDMVPPEEMPFEAYGMQCPFGWEHGDMESVPDYETVDQFLKRTGKKEYPILAPVFVFGVSKMVTTLEGKPIYDKYLRYYGQTEGEFEDGYIAVCAFADMVPPDNWRPQ